MNELAVIGSVILSEGATFAEAGLRVADFESYGCQRVWQELTRRVKAGESINLPAVTAALKKDADLILDAVDACFNVDYVAEYAQLVRAEANRRRVKEIAYNIESGLVENPVEYALKQIGEISESIIIPDLSLIDDDLDEFLEQVGQRKPYATTGFHTLDQELNGFKPGGFYVVGARPAVGKSVFALQTAWGMARPGEKLPAGEKAGLVLFHSLEMSKNELMNRLIADRFLIPLDLLESGKVTKPQADDIRRGRHDLKRLFSINDSAGQSIASIRASARQFVRKGYPLKALFIDYLGLLKDVSEGRSLYESVSQVSTNLKRLAKELNVPVVALAQLNRGVEHRSEKMPTLADLRDSGSIEQDADVVILLSRDQQDQNILLADIAKNRQGKTGVIRFMFDGAFARLRLPR